MISKPSVGRTLKTEKVETDTAPPYGIILANLRAGRVVPFLGSGASIPYTLDEDSWACRYPRAAELAADLAKASEYPSTEAQDLALIAQYFEWIAGRNELTDHLHRIFDKDQEITSLHRFLAEEMTRGVIVTTNYDDLIERAFSQAGREFDLVVHPIGDPLAHVLLYRNGSTQAEEQDPKKLYVDVEERPLIYKMHGTVDRREQPADHFLITEDDYIDFIYKMNGKGALPAIVGQAMAKSNVLFLGYSLRDWNLRLVLKSLGKIKENPDVGKVSWAIQNPVSTVEGKVWQRRNVLLFQVSLADFVEQLRAA